jgi:two-component system response regulator AlgR
MHILIVDDEALARQRLRTLLADCQALQPQTHPQTHYGAGSGPRRPSVSATQSPAGRSIDVLLLDIHMPGQDGLANTATARDEQPPAIVFVTAHIDHALSAFELDAVDSPTKPVRLQRLQQALAKCNGACAAAAAPAPHSYLRLPHVSSAGLVTTEGAGLLIQERGRTERLPLWEVLYLKAEQKYLTVRTLERTYIIDGSLNDWEAQYPDYLLRIHRNALVARRAVRALEKHHDPQEGEVWAVRLQGLAQLLTVSRRQVAAVRQVLAGH